MKMGCFHNFFHFFQTFMSVSITQKKRKEKNNLFNIENSVRERKKNNLSIAIIKM